MHGKTKELLAFSVNPANEGCLRDGCGTGMEPYVGRVADFEDFGK